MWIIKCDDLFVKVKEFIILELVLCYYNLVLFVCLDRDVLFYGIGVVFLYVMEDGIECFIVYVFCILIKVKKVYF